MKFYKDICCSAWISRTYILVLRPRDLVEIGHLLQTGSAWVSFYFVSYKLAVLNIEIIPFQISFNNLTTLTGIALQDPGNSTGLVEKFNISYAISNDAPQDQDFNYTYVSIISKIWKSTLIYNGVT